MKKYIFLVITALLLAGCESFLDTESYTQKNTSNFPQTGEDAKQMLTAAYSVMNDAHNTPNTSHFYTAELASDDRFGGGANTDQIFQIADKLMNYTPSFFEPFWTSHYQGIYRVNMLLEAIDDCEEWSDDNDFNQTKGEALFLRAFFYYELVQIFGQVPLVTTSEAVNLPKASPDEIYAQIASDLKAAIEIMPDKTYDPSFSGHATKFAAEAMMARVFLFYTGYYNNDSLPLTDGGSIGRQQVVTWLEDCINNSGHGLVGDFRNLWPYSNEYTAADYPYARDHALRWETEVNKEAVFSIKFSNLGSWSNQGYSNMLVLYFSLRGNNGYESTFPFGPGWGCGTVNSQLWDTWVAEEPNDIRRQASILDVVDELGDGYEWGAAYQVEETGYWQKKYISIRAKQGSDLTFYSVLMSGAQDNFQLCHTQDLVLIRFADVLLMHSELTETKDGINEVRARVGLNPIQDYTIEALKRERRFELAFEGLRWFDIMRWGEAADRLEEQEGVTIWNNGVQTTMKAFGGGYRARYNATGGFFMIPQSQIDLSGGVLEQNPGWGTADAEYLGW